MAIRRRKGGRHGANSSEAETGTSYQEKDADGSTTGLPWTPVSIFSVAVGLFMAYCSGSTNGWLMMTLHENYLSFSNIKEVEREISFRTETGLYYSYYKQLVNAPTIAQGLYELVHDNITEHGKTINILERFNIYQEVVMALMYRILSLQKTVEPMYFYIHTVFGLHAVLVMSLFGTTWLLSGSCADTTRVWFSMAGRESWAFPFWYMQMFLLTVFFHPNLNRNLKTIIVTDADQHIFQFLMGKFGLSGGQRDFDAQLYLCATSFGVLPLDTFVRLSKYLVFPLYAVVQLCVLLVLMQSVLQNWSTRDLAAWNGVQSSSLSSVPPLLSRRPQLAYHAISAAVFGCLAVSTKRFKYLWTPHMCVLAAAGVADFEAWKILLKKLHIDLSETKVQLVRHVITAGILALLFALALPTTLEELKQRNAFHDPDTVQLMEWIKKETPTTAAFTGSMQLMAGVKLCTGRPITNHPHYEDRDLRIRTKQLYQIYGRRHPKEVHAILKAHGTRYIIVENSICYERGQVHGVGCRLRDLVDMTNHHIVEGGIRGPKDHPAVHPRFCHAVQSGAPQYRIYFTMVFQNKTFRTYKVS
ncbi:protein C-mannosyl-transferase DPY19L3-like [Branchiostoma floridae x Branchiostoma belcheri]